MTNTQGLISSSLADEIAALKRDFSKLGARIRTLEHKVQCSKDSITLRVNYPALRGYEPTVHDLVDTIFYYLVAFALPRSQIDALHALYNKISADDYDIKIAQLNDEARALFKRAQKSTNRNGECGELLLYLLTEWKLDAPQLIAKMSLKTNPSMPVHGSDGIHVRYEPISKSLQFLWGESKLYKNIDAAIQAALNSLSETLDFNSEKHELRLASRYIDLSGFGAEAKAAILSYLDPFDECSNKRESILTCLIGFDFDKYATLNINPASEAEAAFIDEACIALSKISDDVVNALEKHPTLSGTTMELFFFPVPSVSQLRDLFQAKIGWNDD